MWSSRNWCSIFFLQTPHRVVLITLTQELLVRSRAAALAFGKAQRKRAAVLLDCADVSDYFVDRQEISSDISQAKLRFYRFHHLIGHPLCDADSLKQRVIILNSRWRKVMLSLPSSLMACTLLDAKYV